MSEQRRVNEFTSVKYVAGKYTNQLFCYDLINERFKMFKSLEVILTIHNNLILFYFILFYFILFELIYLDRLVDKRTASFDHLRTTTESLGHPQPQCKIRLQ